MNYSKLQFSFILLLIMTIILSLTCFFLVKNLLFTVTSLVAMIGCIGGLVYSIKQEAIYKEAHKNKD